MKISIILLILTFLLAISGCSGCKRDREGGHSGTTYIARVFGNSVTLTWEAPTTSSDGTPLTDLAGYKIYYRTSSGSYGIPINVSDENATNYTVDNLSSGTWCFAVSAYNISGYESNYLNEVCTDI